MAPDERVDGSDGDGVMKVLGSKLMFSIGVDWSMTNAWVS
jgi:hypothetical protein